MDLDDISASGSQNMQQNTGSGTVLQDISTKLSNFANSSKTLFNHKGFKHLNKRRKIAKVMVLPSLIAIVVGFILTICSASPITGEGTPLPEHSSTWLPIGIIVLALGVVTLITSMVVNYVSIRSMYKVMHQEREAMGLETSAEKVTNLLCDSRLQILRSPSPLNVVKPNADEPQQDRMAAVVVITEDNSNNNARAKTKNALSNPNQTKEETVCETNQLGSKGSEGLDVSTAESHSKLTGSTSGQKANHTAALSRDNVNAITKNEKSSDILNTGHNGDGSAGASNLIIGKNTAKNSCLEASVDRLSQQSSVLSLEDDTDGMYQSVEEVPLWRTGGQMDLFGGAGDNSKARNTLVHVIDVEASVSDGYLPAGHVTMLADVSRSDNDINDRDNTKANDPLLKPLVSNLSNAGRNPSRSTPNNYVLKQSITSAFEPYHDHTKTDRSIDSKCPATEDPNDTYNNVVDDEPTFNDFQSTECIFRTDNEGIQCKIHS